MIYIYYLALSFALLFSLPSFASAQDITTGLVGHWKFDEGSGTTASDSSGNSNTGTLTNGPTWTTGKIGGGLSFNGSTQAVEVKQPTGADNDKLGGTTVLGNISLSAWVNYGGYFNQGSCCNSLMARYDIIDPSSYGFYTQSDNKPVFNYGAQTAAVGTASIAGGWHHLVGVRVGNILQLWVDGVKQTDGSAPTNLALNTGFSFWIGRDFNTARYANAAIDDIRVYGRALSASDIFALYALGSGSPPLAGDTQAPTIPTNLSATVQSSSQINLSWTASTDNIGVTGYRIYRRGTQITTVTGTSYSDTALSPSTTYSYTVAAYDAANNVSPQSSSVSATTQASSSGGIPATLGWYEVPNSKMYPVCATNTGFSQVEVAGVEGCYGIINDWNGGVFDSLRNRLVIWGGGHNGYYGNELYAFDLDTLTMSRLNDPGLPTAWGTVYGPSAIANGTQPNSRHTYDQITYVPTHDELFSYSGSVAAQNSGLYNDIWRFNFATMTWSNPTPSGPSPGVPIILEGSMVKYDPVNVRVLVRDLYDLFAYNLTTNTYTKLTTTQVGIGLSYVGVFDPVRQRFYLMGPGGWRYHDLLQPNAPVVTPTTTGCSGFVSSSHPGLVYYPVRDKIVRWLTGNDVMLFDPDSNTCTTETYSGGPTAGVTGTYGRFQYSAQSGVFVVYNDINTNAYTLRLDADPNIPPPSDTQAPTAPANLSTIAQSSSQINLSWIASTDNVGVSGYRVERCQGASCINFAQISTPAGTSYNDTGLTANTVYRYQVRAADAAGNLSGYSAIASATTQSVSGGGSDFATRCAQPGVVKCVGFDQASDITGVWGNNSGITTGAVDPAIDAAVKVSGNSSLKFTIPSNSGANTSGSYFTNFSSDLSVQFGESSEFYYQWRQRFSSEFLSTNYQGSNGWKQEAVTLGDKPGCVPVGGAQNQCATSCEAIGVTMQNTYQRGFAQMYQSCTGSTSHGAYDPLTKLVDLPAPYSRQDILLQNSRPAPYCTYLQGTQTLNGVPPPSYFPPNGNCFGYFPDEWMTFQVRVQVGPRGSAGVPGAAPNDEFVNSHIDVWIAREGQPAQRVFDFGPYNISAGSVAEDQKYGKIWLLPYQTNKDPSQSHPTAYTWYDELIISTNKIADPGTTPPPTTLLGDLNLDGTVNNFDWNIMAGVWFTNDSTADINKDGIVNTADFYFIYKNWNVTG